MNNRKIFRNTFVNKEVAKIFLYGDVGDGGRVDSMRVAQELDQLERESRNIEVRINSNGGDVFNGIAIYNALKNSKADIKIFVDGVAASISAVIALCGKPLYMSRYAKIMIHNVSGGAYGSAEELRRTADTIEELEGDLSEIIAERCKITPEEVRQRFFDGVDHWLNAEKCKEMGLVSSVYDLSDNEEKKLKEASNEREIYQIVNKSRGIFSNIDRDVNNAVAFGLIPEEQKQVFTAFANADFQAFENYLNDKRKLIKTEIANEVDKAFKNRANRAESIKFYNDLGNEIGIVKLKRILSEIPPMMFISNYIDNKPQPNWTLEDYRKFDPCYLLDNPEFHEQLKQKYGEQNPNTLEYYRKNNPDLLRDNPDFYNDLIKRTFNK